MNVYRYYCVCVYKLHYFLYLTFPSGSIIVRMSNEKMYVEIQTWADKKSWAARDLTVTPDR